MKLLEQLWSVLKEGLYEHNDHHEKILPLLRFENSINKNKISLEEYIKIMAKDQKEIYYFANTDKDHIKNSPQLEVLQIKILFYL